MTLLTSGRCSDINDASHNGGLCRQVVDTQELMVRSSLNVLFTVLTAKCCYCRHFKDNDCKTHFLL